MPFSMLQILNRYSPAELTIRAQTVSPIDDGKLHYEEFFPRDTTVRTTRLAEIATVDFRPVASRRPWDAVGRQLPVRVGKVREGEMTPIESFFALGEKEIQRFGEGAIGNEAVIMQAIEADVPTRIHNSAMACWRQVEWDTFNCWVNGIVRVTDPDEASDVNAANAASASKSYDVSFQIDPSRYPAAPSSYATASNPYNQFVTTFVRPASEATGGIEGALLSRTIRDLIVASAPYNAAVPGARPTIQDVENRISQDEGYDFKFRTAEWTMDFPDAAGVYTKQRYFPSNVIAAIPIGKVVGSNKNPKQYKAIDLPQMKALRELGFDENGVLVIPTLQNDGKSVKMTASILDIPWPNEGKVFVQKGA